MVHTLHPANALVSMQQPTYIYTPTFPCNTNESSGDDVTSETEIWVAAAAAVCVCNRQIVKSDRHSFRVSTRFCFHHIRWRSENISIKGETCCFFFSLLVTCKTNGSTPCRARDRWRVNDIRAETSIPNIKVVRHCFGALYFAV